MTTSCTATGYSRVTAKLKGDKVGYVPMPPELAEELRRYPRPIDEVDLAKISDFRFHDLRHTFASWYMMNGAMYELAKILGHSKSK